MLITLFIDYPNKLICMEKDSLKQFVDELTEQTPLTEEHIMVLLSEAVGTVMILNDTKGGWDKMLDLMEPKKIHDNGEFESTDEDEIVGQARADIKAGATNFVAQVKEHYPDMYKETEGRVEQAKRMAEFIEAIRNAENDPELADLLNKEPEGKA